MERELKFTIFERYSSSDRCQLLVCNVRTPNLVNSDVCSSKAAGFSSGSFIASVPQNPSSIPYSFVTALRFMTSRDVT